MPLIYLYPIAIEEAEVPGDGWNRSGDATAAAIDDPYGSWDGVANHCFWADSTGPNAARLRVTMETLPPAFSIQSVTLFARVRRSGGSYTGANFRPFVWIGGTPYYVDPVNWLSPVNYAALAEVDGTVRAPFDYLNVLVKWPRNPFDDSEWEREVINQPGFAGILASNADTATSTGPFLDALTIIVEVTGAPAQLEQARDVGSRYLWRHRRPVRMLSGQPVPRDVGHAVRLMQNLKVRHFAGPHEDGAGWRARPWQERQFKVREWEPRDDGTVIVGGTERREQRVLFYDSMLLQTNVSQTTEDGAMRIGKGGAGTYTRAGDAWSLDPGSRLFTNVAPNTKPFGQYGFESYGEYSNDVPYSAFQAGAITGWALTGGGVNGSAFPAEGGAINALMGETLGWDPVSTGVLQSALAEAGSPHTTSIYRASNATPSYAAETKVGLSIWWTAYVPGQPGYCALQRQVDGWYYAFGSQTWQSGIYWQSLLDDLSLVGTIRGATGEFQSWHASSIDVGADATTLKVIVGLPTGLDVVDAQATRYYAAQISPGLLVGPPAILTGAAPVTRSAGLYRRENNVGKRCVWLPQGAISCIFVPAWRGSEQDVDIKRCLWYVQYGDNGDNSIALYYNNGVNDFTGYSLQFIAEGVEQGAQIDTSGIGVPAGVTLRITARWTGEHGELGVPPFTATMFLVGMDQVGFDRIIKGTDLVFTPPTESDVSFLEIGSRQNLIHFNGAIRQVRCSQWVPTDAECARLP